MTIAGPHRFVTLAWAVRAVLIAGTHGFLGVQLRQPGRTMPTQASPRDTWRTDWVRAQHGSASIQPWAMPARTGRRRPYRRPGLRRKPRR